jgi:bifunctional oligoribonuclease and PAP phosphatase NrnA
MTSSPTPDAMARQVAERIRSGSRFLITSHRNPDGDALGSSLALQGLIRKMGKSADVIVRDDFGKPLRKMPGADGIVIADALPASYPNGYDALFTMECPEHERTGFAVLPGPVVNMDHHLGNRMYGEINYLDIDAPSVGEMVLRMNDHLGVALDADIATAMYVSLATDTGFFRYSNTTARAFDAAQRMIAAGANPGEISLWINESNTLGSIRLLGLCLDTLRVSADGRIATLELRQAFLEASGAGPEDSEGIVNYGRTIDGVLVSALFKEVPEGTRVSMRAKPGVDVQKVAAEFGGGGHKAASGCSIGKPVDEAIRVLMPLLEDAVGGAGTE